jgi:hypothetical protein
MDEDAHSIAGRAVSAIERCMWGHLELLGSDVRPHAPEARDWIADPEACLVQHHAGNRSAPQIEQELGAWFAKHADLTSTARITALARERGTESSPRTVIDSARPWMGRRVHPHEPTWARFRLRGLAGPGLHVELVLLLVTREGACTAPELAALSSFKEQPVRRALGTLARTGWLRVDEHSSSGVQLFRADDRLRATAGPLPGRSGVIWPAVFESLEFIATQASRLSETTDRGTPVDVLDLVERRWTPDDRVERANPPRSRAIDILEQALAATLDQCGVTPSA